MPTKILLKRGANANFAAATLSSGEPAFITDIGKLYIGDGTKKVLINPIDKPAGLDIALNFTKFKVNEYGQIVAQMLLSEADIPSLSVKKITGLGTAATMNTGTANGTIPVLDAANKLPISTIPPINISNITGLGTAATLNAGILAGNVPTLDAGGKLLASTIPSIAISDIFTVASEDAMLLLDAETGDIAVRTDIRSTFILKSAPATLLTNWVELATPTDSVTSVNGATGNVIVTASSIPMTGYVKGTSYSPIVVADNNSVAIGKLEKNFDNFAPLNSPSLTGTPTAITQPTGDNSTKIATTAYVKSSITGYAPLDSPGFINNPTAPTRAILDNSISIATTAFVQSAIAVIDGGTF